MQIDLDNVQSVHGHIIIKSDFAADAPWPLDGRIACNGHWE